MLSCKFADPGKISNVTLCTTLIICMHFREKANLAISLVNKDEKLLAFAAFYDHPCLPNVQQSEWEKWLKLTYNIPQANVNY